MASEALGSLAPAHLEQLRGPRSAVPLHMLCPPPECSLLFSAWEAPAHPSSPSLVKLQRQSEHQRLLPVCSSPLYLSTTCGSFSLGEDLFGGKGNDYLTFASLAAAQNWPRNGL